MDLDAFLGTPGALTGGRSHREVMTEAIELISDESRWTQRAYARSAMGENIKPKDPRTVCWCGLGAIARVSNDLGIVDPQILKYLDAFVEWKYPNRFDSYGDFNDYHSHSVVLGLLKEARDNMEVV